VRLWVVGNLNLSNKKIVNQCGTDPTCTPFHVKVYGINADGTPASTGILTLEHWFKSDAMLIFTPQLNGCLWISLLKRFEFCV
jgi:hypothetical protein